MRAREERDKRAGMVADGKSPVQQKKLERQKLTAEMTLREFGEEYFVEVIQKRWRDPRNIRRWLDNDIYPPLGNKALKESTPAEVQALVFRKRDHGFESAAAKIREVLKGLFDYAIACHLLMMNPMPHCRCVLLRVHEPALGLSRRTRFASTFRRFTRATSAGNSSLPYT